MDTIESTPEMAARVYEKLARNIEVARRRLARPLTLSEKLLIGHLDDPQHQELEPGASYVMLRPDRVVLQDVLGQTAMLQFMQARRDRVAVPTSIHCDHLIQARVEGAADLSASLEENREIYEFLRSAAARYGAGFWEPGAGIMHQVVLENYAFPGALIIGTDSHTTNSGGLGACAVGVGGADAVEVMAGLPWEVLYPRRIAVVLTGKLSGWAAPKDVILYVAGQLTVAGGTNAIVEYIGPGARTISATGKATITNMGAELGATTSIFPADERTCEYLRATRRGDLVPLVERYRSLLEPDARVEAKPDLYYDRVLELDLSKLEPHVVGPHSPDRARPISKLAAEVSDAKNSFRDAISTALIGSCTNSSYEDMSRAADVAEQARAHGVKAAVPLMVTPGSAQIRATIERDGQLRSLNNIGAVVLANACGPCIGQWRRTEAETPNTIVTSYNRNFPGRNDGHRTTMNFIASPEIVTAFALAGRLSFNPLTDSLVGADGKPFRLDPPRPAPEVPRQRLRAGRYGLRAAAVGWQKCHAARESPQRTNPVDGAVARVGRPRLRRHADPRQDQGQDHYRSHFAGGPLACVSRASGQVQRQHVHRCDQRVHWRSRQDKKYSQRRNRPRDFESRQRLPRARNQMGRYRRLELRRGQQPRACRPLTATARWCGRDCPQLRAHPRVQSEEAGAARADLSRSG